MVISTSCKTHPRFRNVNTGHSACLGLKRVACCSHQKTGTSSKSHNPETVSTDSNTDKEMTSDRSHGQHYGAVKSKNYRECPGSPGVETFPSTAGDARPPLVRELGSHLSPGRKKKTLKQKQYCNKFNKNLKKKEKARTTATHSTRDDAPALCRATVARYQRTQGWEDFLQVNPKPSL